MREKLINFWNAVNPFFSKYFSVIYKSITLKLVIISWIIIIVPLFIIGIFNYNSQKNIILKRMSIEALNTSESIIQAYGPSLFTEEFESVVDFCTKIVTGSSSLDFIVITKHNGESLIFKPNSWRFEELGDSWVHPNESLSGVIVNTEIEEPECYLQSKPLVFSGIDWGFIHVGVSLVDYNIEIQNQVNRTIIFLIVFMIIALLLSVMFSGRLTMPIKELLRATKEIEAGNLKSRSLIFGDDELGLLAQSFNTMADNIEHSNDFLEERVKERTSELGATNKKLKNEIIEREKAESILQNYTITLETQKQIYKEIINSVNAADIFYNTIKMINERIFNFDISFLVLLDSENKRMTVDCYHDKGNGFERNFIAFENTTEICEKEFSEKEEFFINNDIDKKENRNKIEELAFQEGIKGCIVFPIFYQGQFTGTIIFGIKQNFQYVDEQVKILIEITNHLSIAVLQSVLEEKLRAHADDIDKSLKEKEILLKEIHHRVKNNLQVISSLLFLQSKKTKDKLSLQLLLESQSRVRSLALVHEKLYKSDNLSQIDFGDYVKNLLPNIKNMYKQDAGNIRIDLQLEKVLMSIEKAVPLGLMLNELLTNSFKHAFPKSLEQSEKVIFIKTLQNNEDTDKTVLVVGDNGIGMPEDFNYEESDSLGIKILHSLVDQIDGGLKINPRNNTEFIIEFSI